MEIVTVEQGWRCSPTAVQGLGFSAPLTEGAARPRFAALNRGGDPGAGVHSGAGAGIHSGAGAGVHQQRMKATNPCIATDPVSRVWKHIEY